MPAAPCRVLHLIRTSNALLLAISKALSWATDTKDSGSSGKMSSLAGKNTSVFLSTEITDFLQV